MGDVDFFDSVFEENPVLEQENQSTLTIPVNLPANSYDILIDQGLLHQAGTLITTHCQTISKVVVVADRGLPTEYIDILSNSLFQSGLKTKVYPCTPGDENKIFAAYQQLTTDILAAGVDRNTVIVTLGGGVTGDLGGFVASTLLRGLRFVQIPTTLLSQVDSSVGGKTGINMPTGKNLLGSFWQPSLVIIDIDLLKTLPERELKAGYAEVLKYGLINDRNFFDWLEENGRSVLDLSPQSIKHAVATSCRSKAAVVIADEREKGQRALLNLGHTFGHAIEAVLNYDNRVLHGEAVALGCLMAFRLSVNLKYCPESDYNLLARHLEKHNYDLTLPAVHDWSIADLMTAMYKDKKTLNNNLNLILANGIGQSFIAKDVPGDVVEKTWQQFL